MNIDSLTEEELVLLNHKIIDRLNYLDLHRTQTKMLEFHKGQAVCFTPSSGETVYGIISKINIKTISVSENNGRMWKVSPQFLKPFEFKKEQKEVVRDVTPQRNKLSNGPSKNSPCPCGSRKKYKRCCFKNEPDVVHF